jgi:hypothetical protein
MVQRDNVPEGVNDIETYNLLINALEAASNISANVDNQPISVDDNSGSLTIDTDDGAPATYI